MVEVIGTEAITELDAFETAIEGDLEASGIVAEELDGLGMTAEAEVDAVGTTPDIETESACLEETVRMANKLWLGVDFEGEGVPDELELALAPQVAS